MELRFIHGDFGNIKYKLQYREFDMHNQITEWKDVPVVEMSNPIQEVVKHKLNINKTYECLKRIEKNIQDVKDGEYSFQRAFNNILELTDVALEHIYKEL